MSCTATCTIAITLLAELNVIIMARSVVPARILVDVQGRASHKATASGMAQVYDDAMRTA